MKQIDWNLVQAYYDNDHTWAEVLVEFSLCNATVAKAVKAGKFKCRSKSEASILDYKRKPRTLSDETKSKISKGRLAYLLANPDKVPYKLNHYSKGASYPERYFHTVLQGKGLMYERYKQVSIYNLDFAFPTMVDLEIDGEQHYCDTRIVTSNKRRDAYLSARGWKVVRVRWSSFKRLSETDKEMFIADLINGLVA